MAEEVFFGFVTKMCAKSATIFVTGLRTAAARRATRRRRRQRQPRPQLQQQPQSPAPKAKVDAATRAQQMCLFDIETNIFPIEVIEFGAIVVDKFSFVEASPRVSTLIRPPSGAISAKATACHGLTYADVKDAPAFAEVAARIHDALDGRIWVGHNINTFDVPHLCAAFEEANHPVPVPAGVLDTLPLVRRVFGKRAGNAKMATLGRYFGFGEEKHRAVEDCEITLQVLKSVALAHCSSSTCPRSFPSSSRRRTPPLRPPQQQRLGSANQTG